MKISKILSIICVIALVLTVVVVPTTMSASADEPTYHLGYDIDFSSSDSSVVTAGTAATDENSRSFYPIRYTTSTDGNALTNLPTTELVTLKDGSGNDHTLLKIHAVRGTYSPTNIGIIFLDEKGKPYVVDSNSTYTITATMYVQKGYQYFGVEFGSGITSDVSTTVHFSSPNFKRMNNTTAWSVEVPSYTGRTDQTTPPGTYGTKTIAFGMADATLTSQFVSNYNKTNWYDLKVPFSAEFKTDNEERTGHTYKYSMNTFDDYLGILIKSPFVSTTDTSAEFTIYLDDVEITKTAGSGIVVDPTVTLNYGNGTANKSFTAAVGTALPTTMTKAGYSFNGWHVDSVDGEVVTAIADSLDGKTLYAGWTYTGITTYNFENNEIIMTAAKDTLGERYITYNSTQYKILAQNIGGNYVNSYTGHANSATMGVDGSQALPILGSGSTAGGSYPLNDGTNFYLLESNTDYKVTMDMKVSSTAGTAYPTIKLAAAATYESANSRFTNSVGLQYRTVMAGITGSTTTYTTSDENNQLITADCSDSFVNRTFYFNSGTIPAATTTKPIPNALVLAGTSNKTNPVYLDNITVEASKIKAVVPTGASAAGVKGFYGDTITELPNGTWANGVFQGWYLDENYQTEVTYPFDVSSEDITIYGKFEEIPSGWVPVEGVENGYKYYASAQDYLDGKCYMGWKKVDNVVYDFGSEGVCIKGLTTYQSTDGEFTIDFSRNDNAMAFEKDAEQPNNYSLQKFKITVGGDEPVSYYVTGWQIVGNCKRYFNPVTGYQTCENTVIDGALCLFRSNGEFLGKYTGVYQGTLLDDGVPYVGELGWVPLGEGENEKKYYVPDEGDAYADGIFAVGETMYEFDSTGVCKGEYTGVYDTTLFINGLPYVSGVGWIKDGEDYYYITKLTNKALSGGNFTIGGVIYIFDAKGKNTGTFTGFMDEKYYENGEVKKGWITIGDDTYYASSKTGKLLKDGSYTIGGKLYTFDANGVRQGVASGIVQVGDIYKYFNEEGVAQNGWITVGEDTYYATYKTGELLTDGVYVIGGKAYEFDDEFKLVGYATGIIQVGDIFEYFDNGELQKGWITVGDDTYYATYKTGELLADGAYIIGGKYYTFDENCVSQGLLNGFSDASGILSYYLNGLVKTGWTEIENNKYYVSKITDKLLVDGNYAIDGIVCHFDETGIFDGYANGLVELSGVVKYYDGKGGYKTGWIQDGDNTYYAKLVVGVVLRNGTFSIAGKYYTFDENCVCQGLLNGFSDVSGQTYYYENGVIKSGWISDGGNTYYAKLGVGTIFRDGTYTIGGVQYTFDADGKLVTE